MKCKILEICPFSTGICGVWSRVFAESKLLSQMGNEVFVFSSNLEKGTNKKVDDYEEKEGVKIKRFKTKKGKFSENVKYFNFSRELKDLNPDVVVTHLLHPHSFKALKQCKKMGKKCYLVTHAPFNVKRKFPLNILTNMYTNLKIRPEIKGFEKIISITNWEKHYLNRLGIDDELIYFIPNGIPDEFFKQKITKFKGEKILFFGRVAPVKNIELLLNVVSGVSADVELDITGVAEANYLRKLKKIIKNLGLKNVKINGPVFELEEKIKKIQGADLFVLPSKREAMPIALIEAMALGKVVIASHTDGANEVIDNGKNGFIFKDENDLKEKIEFFLDNKNKKSIEKIQRAAKKSSEQFKWSKLIEKLEEVLDG